MGWREVGLRGLNAAGWSPVGEGINSPRTPPPMFKRSAPFVAGTVNDCTWIGQKEQQFIGEQSIGASNMLHVEVGARRQGDRYVLMSYLRDPSGEVRVKCEYIGYCSGHGVPMFVRETTIADVCPGLV